MPVVVPASAPATAYLSVLYSPFSLYGDTVRYSDGNGVRSFPVHQFDYDLAFLYSEVSYSYANRKVMVLGRGIGIPVEGNAVRVVNLKVFDWDEAQLDLVSDLYFEGDRTSVLGLTPSDLVFGVRNSPWPRIYNAGPEDYLPSLLIRQGGHWEKGEKLVQVNHTVMPSSTVSRAIFHTFFKCSLQTAELDCSLHTIVLNHAANFEAYNSGSSWDPAGFRFLFNPGPEEFFQIDKSLWNRPPYAY